MRKEASLDMWKTLYNLTAELKELQPWDDLGALDFIGIQENGREEPVFVRVMGQKNAKEAKGITMYDGTLGLGYLQQLVRAPETCMSQEYAVMDQQSLMLCFGERMEVPEEQRAVIKELGLKFAGKGNWPFFLSFQTRFTPWTPDADEVRLMAETLVQVIEAVKALREERVTVKFDEGEFCFRYFDVDQLNWMTAPARMPLVNLEVDPLVITDELFLHRLKKQPVNDAELLLDFLYMNAAIEDEQYDRPLNPLVFLVFDKVHSSIVHMDMISPDEEETEQSAEFLLAYIEEAGRPRSISVRNPYVITELKDTCEKLGIELREEKLPELDLICEQFMEQFTAGIGNHEGQEE